MSTLLEIRTKIQANWPTGYHSSDITDAIVNGWINQAQRELCRRHAFAFMEIEATQSTADATRKYAVPAVSDGNWTDANSGTTRRFRSEISCELLDRNSERIELTKLFKNDIEKKSRYSDTTDGGTPESYCIQNGYLELWPLPDHTNNGGSAWTINLEYYGYLPDLSGDSSTNFISIEYPEYLEYMATAFGFYFGMDKEQGDYWKERAEQVYQEMVYQDNEKALGNIERGIEPESGQSLASDFGERLDIKAHYA